MSQPDFNGALAGLRELSEAYAVAAKAFRSDDGYKDAATRPEVRKALDATFEVVFETAAIFSAIAPNQLAAVLRENPEQQLHAFHSAGARRALKAATSKAAGAPPLTFDFGASLARLVLSRPGVGDVLEAEVRRMLEAADLAAAPPPAIKRRSSRA